MKSMNISAQAAEDARIEAELDAEDARFFATMRRWGVIGLIAIGIGLVVGANTLGIAWVKSPYGVWNPNDAAQVALTLRTLGVMAFAAGLAERLILVWQNNAHSG